MANRITKQQIYILIAFMSLLIGVVMWQYITPGRKTEQAATQLVEIAERIRRKYAAKIDYWGLNTQVVINNKILQEFSTDGENLINALGKPFNIGQGENAETVMPGEKSFDIIYTGLSMGECIALASFPMKHPEEVGLLKITIINAKENKTFNWGANDYKLPISRDAARKVCKKDSKIIWTIE